MIKTTPGEASKQLRQELTELKKLGIKVPKKAFDLAKDEKFLRENANLSISVMADLAIYMAVL